jgi:hypothetical protein
MMFGALAFNAPSHASRAASSANPAPRNRSQRTVRFGLKRGKLVYVFKYCTYDVERDKHRNVITRARLIKDQLERDGYRLIPWDFKKGQPPGFWAEETMDEEDDDLYGPSETTATTEKKTEEVKDEGGSEGDEPMDEGLESGEDESSSDDSVHTYPAPTYAFQANQILRTTSNSSLTAHRKPPSPPSRPNPQEAKP